MSTLETGFIQSCTVAELIDLIRRTFPDSEKDVILDFKVKGRRYSNKHGKAISTTVIQGPTA